MTLPVLRPGGARQALRLAQRQLREGAAAAAADGGGEDVGALRARLRREAEAWLEQEEAEAAARVAVRARDGRAKLYGCAELGDAGEAEREADSEALAWDARVGRYEDWDGATLLPRLARLREQRAAAGGASRLVRLARAAARGDVREIHALRVLAGERDARGWTPLHYAALFVQPLAVRALLECGVSREAEAPGTLAPRRPGGDAMGDDSDHSDSEESSCEPGVITPAALLALHDRASAAEAGAARRIRYLLARVRARAPLVPSAKTLAGLDESCESEDEPDLQPVGVDVGAIGVRMPSLFKSSRGREAATHGSVVTRNNVRFLGKGALRRAVFDPNLVAGGMGGCAPACPLTRDAPPELITRCIRSGGAGHVCLCVHASVTGCMRVCCFRCSARALLTRA